MIYLSELHFSFKDSHFQLKIEELKINQGERIAFIGPSGSGKTTLLHLLAGIILPDSGIIKVNETNLLSLNESKRREFRIKNIGLAFQEFELLEHLSVLDNILLPFRISSTLSLSSEVKQRASELLLGTGINDKKLRSIQKLSQGERQRVAVCRSLITQPMLVLADEPTGNLDPENKHVLMNLLLDDAKQRGTTLITVTHDHNLLDGFDRVIDFAEFHSFTEVQQ
jgi:putative ABC transport system ATP-binding protein